MSASIGMFATLRGLGIPKLVCTGSEYICKENDILYYDGGILGTCLWPNTMCISSDLEPICVLSLDEKVHCIVEHEGREEISIFDGDLRDLVNRKVYKSGVTTGKTFGYIERDYQMLCSRSVIVASETDDKPFSAPGDTGSIVLTKMGKDTVALGIVIGSVVMIRNLSATSTLVVSLKDALSQFTTHYECEIENPFLLD
jgi:hypothetical protein